MDFLLGPNEVIRAASTVLSYDDIPQDDFALSYLNTPIYDELTILKQENPSLELSEDFVITELIFRVNRPRNIVRTKVQGRDGDVNEFISNGDFNIEVLGLLVSEDQLVQPIDQLIILNNILSFEGSLAVASDYLQSLDIDTIVVDSYSIDQEAGVRNQIPFRIQARSENPIELEIQNSSNANTQ